MCNLARAKEQTILTHKKILLGVSGSISIYKSLELIRLYVKAGAKVRVIMTEGAKRFIAPLTFEALCGHPVLTEATESWSNDNNHIAIGKWADLFVIAPATANTINKLANGIADNLLTQTALAYTGVKLIAPAANTHMMQNPLTVSSLKMLKLINYEVVNPVKKLLACGDEGNGALAEVEDIYHKSLQILLREPFWINRRVIVTGGGTIEKIDDVRFISNFSSGKMAEALATALYLKGADVCLITSSKQATTPSELYRIELESAEELEHYLVDAIRVAKKGVLTKATLMDESVPQLLQKKPFLFMAAAVSDYKPKYPQKGKLKKEMMGDVWQLELQKNSDILANLHKEGIFTVGFKAEMDEENALKNAKKMLETKNLDAVCLNNVSKFAFGDENNAITFITKDELTQTFEGSKRDLSLALLTHIAKTFPA